MSKKKGLGFLFFYIRTSEDFFVFVFTNIVVLIPGISRGAKLIKTHQFNVETIKTLLNYSKNAYDDAYEDDRVVRFLSAAWSSG